jgi:hypothetical protein
VGVAGYRAWQIISVVFLGIGLLELVLRGLVEGSKASLVVGVVSLMASTSGFWEARSQKRNAEIRLAEIRHLRLVDRHPGSRHLHVVRPWDAVGERPGPGRPR